MGEFAGALVNALRGFITRDIMYLVGGGSVCATLLHISGQGLTTPYPTAIWLLAAGVAYGVGYAIQEILSLSRILTTGPVLEPGRIVKWLYKRFTGQRWKDVDRLGWEAKQQKFEELASERTFAQFQRTIGLKHIGATLGANWLVSGCALGTYVYRTESYKSDLLLAVAVLVLALGLMIMSWVKGGQQTQYVWSWKEPN